MKKNIISITLTFLLLSSTAVHANEFKIFHTEPRGISEIILDENGNEISNYKIPVRRAARSANELPQKYDSRDYGIVTPVKSQGSFGTCWAHSALSCAESNMIKKSFETLSVDYSELHLSYFSSKKDPKFMDGNDRTSESYGYFGGGNSRLAAFCLSNSQGTAPENMFPYSKASSSLDFSIDEGSRYFSNASLVSYGKTDDISAAKKAIMEYGSVATAYCDSSMFLNNRKYYYCPTRYTTNHAVTIVGWDDTVSKDSFATSPEGDGAWIVKNSWGTWWGENGYFYLSYYDKSISGYDFFDMENTKSGTKAYTYNGSAATYMLNADFANVFCAEKDGSLSAVSFETSTASGLTASTYEIEIYNLGKNTPNSPVNSTPACTINGSVNFDGYHRIKLDTVVELQAGDYFSIIVRLRTSSGLNAIQYLEGYSEGSDVTFHSNKGESFFYSYGTWRDLSTFSQSGTKFCNSTIKGYVVSPQSRLYASGNAIYFENIPLGSWLIEAEYSENKLRSIRRIKTEAENGSYSVSSENTKYMIWSADLTRPLCPAIQR